MFDSLLMWLSCLLDLYFDINHVYNVLHVLLTIVTAATVLDEEAPKFSMYPKQNERTNADKNNLVQIPTNGSEITQLPLQVKVDRTIAQDGSAQNFRPYNPSQNVKQSTNGVKDAIHLKHIPTMGHKDVQPVLALANTEWILVKFQGFLKVVNWFLIKLVMSFHLMWKIWTFHGVILF